MLDYHLPRTYLAVKNDMSTIRRYDLDWLRVSVFGLLILYHVGMFFVPWGWHIKNNVIYPELRWPMLFVNQWRLPILFVISGMGTAFALSFRSGGQFRQERLQRLGIPLVFGILMVVPPQVYLERLVSGTFQGSYLDFLRTVAFTQGVYPAGNISWHHLWFLPYLLVYSLLLSPVFIYLRNHPQARVLRTLRRWLTEYPLRMYWFVVPLYLYEALLEPFFPVTHNLVWDWFNFISSATLFLYGFLLISVRDAFWTTVERLRKKALFLGSVCFLAMLGIWLYLEDGMVVHFTEAALKVINMWSWILVLFGYGAKYLNHPSRTVTYANRAVYPFYILHQTITIILGYFLMDMNWGLTPKFTILTLGTFGGAWLLYEGLIKPIPFLHPLFGLKPQKKQELRSARIKRQLLQD